VAYNDWGVSLISAAGELARRQLDADGIHDVRVEGSAVVGTFEAVSKGGRLEPFSIPLEDP
jgi:hypothetical protein